MQTDPNFANYLYNADTQQIVLLDFGATRNFKAGFSAQYKKLVKAALDGDETGICNAAAKLGYAVGEQNTAYRALVTELFRTVLEPLKQQQSFDFANTDLPARLGKLGEHARAFRDFWQAPPADAVYLHRKVGGMFLLATRLQAQVNLRQLVSEWLD
ncbi:MAG: hypothetical protein HKO71_06345 [Pseudomonadales bacterium]|nr:hypothetical protein [Pseudomonadales bacterium]